MIDDLREEEIVNKVGGRFKLSTLIQKRLVAHRELSESHHYRHRVVNDNVEDALAAMKTILFAAGLPQQPNCQQAPA